MSDTNIVLFFLYLLIAGTIAPIIAWLMIGRANNSFVRKAHLPLTLLAAAAWPAFAALWLLMGLYYTVRMTVIEIVVMAFAINKWVRRG